MHWNCNSLENLCALRKFPVHWPGPKHDVAVCHLSTAEERRPHHVKIDDGHTRYRCVVQPCVLSFGG
jgi:hypothetical protein